MSRKVKGLSEPRTVCPITGGTIHIVRISSGDWQIRGPGWIGTQMFQFKSDAEWWVSHNYGVQPEYPNPRDSVKVVGERSEVSEDEVTPEVEAALKAGEQLADDAEKLLVK